MDDSGLSDAAVFDADSLIRLQLCKVTGEGDATTLVVPRCSIRQKYLQDPKKCRRMATNPAAPAVQANGDKSCSPCRSASWRNIFPDSPSRQWKIWRQKKSIRPCDQASWGAAAVCLIVWFHRKVRYHNLARWMVGRPLFAFSFGRCWPVFNCEIVVFRECNGFTVLQIK